MTYLFFLFRPQISESGGLEWASTINHLPLPPQNQLPPTPSKPKHSAFPLKTWKSQVKENSKLLNLDIDRFSIRLLNISI